MKPLLLSALLVLVVSGSALARSQEEPPNLARILAGAERALEQGDLPGARIRIQRALERDRRATEAWGLLARWGELTEERDEEIYALHNQLRLSVSQKRPKAEIEALRARLLERDPLAADLLGMKDLFLKRLFPIAERYVKEERPHGAIRVYKQILALDPENQVAKDAIELLAASPDPSLAGDAKPKDLFADVTEEWILEHDGKHMEWGDRAKLRRENYVTQTNAGYEVLVRTAEAMEQMNAFYREFFRYGTEEHGGSVGRIDVNIFKTRDEYLKHGIGPPVEWSGGHYTGGAVETYIGSGGFASMTGTLFHEAAHQFVDIATNASGWLNEGLASFFEGTRILPNGTVIMNMPAAHRLIPLADRMDRGWMENEDDGIDPSNVSATPEKAPSFRIVMENRYQWGPPWYAPTWGVVYFLYNYQDPIDGRFVYRRAFQEFIDKSGGRVGAGAVRNFEEVVLARPAPPIKGVDRPDGTKEIALPTTIDELNDVWKEWIQQLRSETTGVVEVERPYKQWGRYAVMNGDYYVAKDHFEKGLVEDPDDIELLEEFADLLARHMEDEDRASKLVMEAIYFVEQQDPVDERKLEQLDKLYSKLDPQRKSLGQVMEELEATARSIVERYRGAGRDLMVMDVSWRLGSDLGLSDLFSMYEQTIRTSRKTTEIWSLAYNEDGLEGWNPQGTAPIFTAEGRHMLGRFGAYQEEQYTFSALTLDKVTFGDFSMQAEVQAEKGKVNFCGFVFGQKDSSTFHSMLVFPERTKVREGVAATGFVDLMSNFGGTTKTWRHIPVDTAPPADRSTAGHWIDLRLDVAGRFVDMWFEGELIASHEFANLDVLRGSFGLLMGPGEARFRNVRYIARDPRDPGGRIRREINLEELRKASGGAVGGSFVGLQPPFPQIKRWVQGTERQAWGEVGYVPQLLVFFSINQNNLVPIDGWLRDLAAKNEQYGLEIVAVCSPNDEEAIESYLQSHPLPGSVGIDLRPPGVVGIGNSFEAFFIRRFNLPRILLLDLDRTVAWEGDPGFGQATPYSPGVESFLDVPLQELFDKRKLLEIARWRQRWERVVKPGMATGRFLEFLPDLVEAGEYRPRFAPDAGQAAGRLSSVQASLAAIDSTAAGFERDGAQPAFGILLDWASEMKHRFDRKQIKALRSVAEGDITKDWESLLRDLKKWERKKGTFAEKVPELLEAMSRKEGLFPRELLADLEPVAADEAAFLEILEGAEDRPLQWLAQEYFGWE